MGSLRSLGSLLLVGLAAAACGSSGTSPAEPSPSAPPTPASEWPMYGHDAARTSYNASEAGLTVARVGALAPRWQAQIGTGPLPPSCAPAVAGGRVFVCSSRTDGDNFFAFDARTGQKLWSSYLGQPQGGTVGIGASPAVGNGIVVAGGADGAYYGLDAATGAIRWRHELASGPTILRGPRLSSRATGSGSAFPRRASRPVRAKCACWIWAPARFCRGRPSYRMENAVETSGTRLRSVQMGRSWCSPPATISDALTAC